MLFYWQDDVEMDSEDDFEDAHDHFSLDDNFLDPEIPGPRKPEPMSRFLFSVNYWFIFAIMLWMC